MRTNVSRMIIRPISKQNFGPIPFSHKYSKQPSPPAYCRFNRIECHIISLWKWRKKNKSFLVFIHLAEDPLSWNSLEKCFDEKKLKFFRRKSSRISMFFSCVYFVLFLLKSRREKFLQKKQRLRFLFSACVWQLAIEILLNSQFNCIRNQNLTYRWNLRKKRSQSILIKVDKQKKA